MGIFTARAMVGGELGCPWRCWRINPPEVLAGDPMQGPALAWAMESWNYGMVIPGRVPSSPAPFLVLRNHKIPDWVWVGGTLKLIPFHPLPNCSYLSIKLQFFLEEDTEVAWSR